MLPRVKTHKEHYLQVDIIIPVPLYNNESNAAKYNNDDNNGNNYNDNNNNYFYYLREGEDCAMRSV